MNKMLMILLSLLLFIIGLLLFNTSLIKKEVNENKIVEITAKPDETTTVATIEPYITPTFSEEPIVEDIKPTYDPTLFTDLDSLLILANKTHGLPSDYEPNDLITPNVKVNKSGLKLREEAAKAIELMFNAANEEGITLVLGSSYRSYKYQANLFSSYVLKDGEEKANKYSSKPGHSDHQTGLAVDISDASGANYLKQSFKDTPEGQWLKVNAHKFGFILRYPEGKEEITGYIFEPWHFRYIGVEEAGKVYESGLSFEEYYNILD